MPAYGIVSIGTVVDHLLHTGHRIALHFEEQDAVEVGLQSADREIAG